ncbi:hypothetical protein [Salininema proteolyticum]|uniref:Uncharacterized protein n=1 Tax=Salininema proteolyticum TaxID=1607685 RepID=A0ABV8TZE6_9ACTN
MDRGLDLKGVDLEALGKLSDEYHDREVRPVGTRSLAGHVAKLYGIEAPGRTVTPELIDLTASIAEDWLRLGRTRSSTGLATVITHLGGDGDYLVVHSWIGGFMSDMAVFHRTGGGEFRPGWTGLAPCVWEAAVLDHERGAYSRLLDGDGDLPRRIEAWSADVLSGPVR